ncbi:hypothetical protein [Eubacterium sp.]
MKITFRKIDIWKFLFLYLIFQATISSLIKNEFISNFFGYSDEAIGVILFIIVIFKALKSEITLLKFERYMLVFMFIFEIIGIISGFKYKYQEIPYMFVDAYTCAKFFIYYLCARLLTQGKLAKDYFLSINRICKIVAVIFFALSLHEVLFDQWWPNPDYRYFAYSVQLFFGHPESLARACITFIFVLAYNYRYCKHNIYYIIMLTIVMIFTFRTKAIVGVFAIYILYIFFIKLKFKSVIPVGIIGISGATYLGYNSLYKYYFEIDESARKILTFDSIEIAKSFFPLGSGFGSYASNIAAEKYSKLYINLGYYSKDNIQIGEKRHSFLSDTFWPIVVAQTGWIGTISFIMALLSMITYIIKSRKTDVYYFWVAISIVAYDLISSFATSAFFHPSAIAPYLLLGLITSIHEFPKKQ